MSIGTVAPPGLPDRAGDSRPGRGGRPGASQDAIFEAVLDLLVQTGYEAMTVDAVAARAHVSKATVYKRWEGKPRLVVAALQCHAEQLPVEPDEGSLRADLLAFAGHLNNSDDRTGGLIAALAHAIQRDPQLSDVVQTEMGGTIRAALGTVVRRGVARGELAAAPPPEHLVYDLLPLMIIARLMFSGARYPQFVLEQLIDDVVLPSLRAAAPGAPHLPSSPTPPDTVVPEAQHHHHTEQGRT